MSRTALRAFVPWVISLVGILIGMALIATTPPARVPVGFRVEDGLSYLLLPLASTTIGAIVAWRQPRNAVGWLLGALGWITSWQYLTVGYAIHGLFGETRLPLTEVAAWAFSWSGMWVGAVAGNLLVRFPDGRIAERRGWLAVVLLVVGAALATTALGFRQGQLFLFRDVANPFGIAGADGVLDTAMGTAGLLDVVAGVLGFNALLRRSARAVGVEKQQFKWFMAGVLLAFAVILVGGSLLLNNLNIAQFVISNGVAAVPVSVGVAVLRYRLYDIDLFIKRTVVYGGTSLAIALTFFIGILALQALLRPLTAGSEVAVAASTLGTLALLQPIRRRVQNAVDRRFDRARHDAARTIEAFAEQLRDEVDLDALRTDLLGAVQQTMAPAHSSLWLREPHP